MHHGKVAGSLDSTDATKSQQTKASAKAVGHLVVRQAHA
jgi:hypothetical protein